MAALAGKNAGDMNAVNFIDKTKHARDEGIFNAAFSNESVRICRTLHCSERRQIVRVIDGRRASIATAQDHFTLYKPTWVGYSW